MLETIKDNRCLHCYFFTLQKLSENIQVPSGLTRNAVTKMFWMFVAHCCVLDGSVLILSPYGEHRVIRTTENMWKLQETRLCCNKTSMTAAWIFCSAAFHINTKYGIIKTNIAERCHIWPLLWIACMSKHKYCFSITHLWAQHVLEIWTPSPEDVRGKTINVTLQTETSRRSS